MAALSVREYRCQGTACARARARVRRTLLSCHFCPCVQFGATLLFLHSFILSTMSAHDAMQYRLCIASKLAPRAFSLCTVHCSFDCNTSGAHDCSRTPATACHGPKFLAPNASASVSQSVLHGEGSFIRNCNNPCASRTASGPAWIVKWLLPSCHRRHPPLGQDHTAACYKAHF